MKKLSSLFNRLVSPITNWVKREYAEYLETKRQEVELMNEHGLRWNYDMNMPEIDPTHPKWRGP